MPEISKFFGIIISLYWRDHRSANGANLAPAFLHGIGMTA